MRPRFRDALAAQTPLITPLAHDALSARLIEAAGFKGFAVGGSALLAARYGLPDLGLIGLADMVDGMREIAEATDLPFVADADDGYGDVKSVVRTVHAYERIGVGGLLIEDQIRDVKQQRAERARGVADRATIETKLRIALDSRSSRDLFVIGRTDAYGTDGLDEALRRAERFLALGVDGVFIAGLQAEAEFERVGRTLRGAMISAAQFEAATTPWIRPSVLGEMGFSQVSFPASLILRVTEAIAAGLEDLKAFAAGDGEGRRLPAGHRARGLLDGATRAAAWQAIAEGAAAGPAEGRGAPSDDFDQTGEVREQSHR